MSDTSKAPIPREGIMQISPYVGGKSSIEGVEKIYKLSSNESPFGASPLAKEAINKAAASLALYPDGGASALREAIGQKYGLNPANIICSNGSDEILGLIAHCYLGPGDEAIITEHGFVVYKIQTLATGATPVIVKEKDCRVDVDAMIAAISEKTKVVFLANPGNPTGTYIPIEDIRRLHAALPNDVILVLDAAYAEYVRRNDYEAGIELVANAKNVIMTRTFSKIYGLAALRLGWTYAPQGIIDVLNRVRGPFNVNALALAAGEASLKDHAFIDTAVEFNLVWLEKLTHAFEKIGLKVTPSVANFVLIHFPDTDGKRAQDADAFLTARGFILRNAGMADLPNALRMTIGTEDVNRAVIEALGEFMER